METYSTCLNTGLSDRLHRLTCSLCFTVAVLIQNIDECEYVTEPGFIPAAATCYSAYGRTMRVLRLSENDGPAELLGRQTSDDSREIYQRKCLRTSNR